MDDHSDYPQRMSSVMGHRQNVAASHAFSTMEAHPALHQEQSCQSTVTVWVSARYLQGSGNVSSLGVQWLCVQ